MQNGTSSSRFIAVLLLFVIACAHSRAFAQKPKPAPPAPAAPTNPDDAQKKKEEAKARFEKGMTLFDRKAWDPALAEFLESRAAYPTRSNTQNAAICLRNLNRFDEALEMFEVLLHDFPNLSAQERAAVDKEIKELESLVGTVELRGGETGAQISVDGREHGVLPSAPIRVSAGSHSVRVYKEGFAPFEKRIEVAGRQQLVVDVKFESIGQAGRLSITEDSGKLADVVVDNIVVGKTPWQGLIAVGDHVVFLRGEGNLGTQPASATVRINQVTPIVLALEPLECAMRVEPTPNGATVAIDGVQVGSGLWDGRLRKGRHRVEVGQNGFLPQERFIELAPQKSERLVVTLERDPNSPLWRVQKGPRIYIELAPSFPFGLVLGGDVADSGSASFPIGVNGRVHAGYELPSGLGFGLDAGYLYIARKIEGRDEVLTPVGKPPVAGTVADRVSLRGLVIGGSAQLHSGEKIPLTFRLGVGALLANAADRRSGDFSDGGATVSVATTRTTSDLVYLYVAPEARIGYRIASGVEINAGVDVMLMVGLGNAKWDTAQGVVLGKQGLATYDADKSYFGGTLLLVNPGVGARFDF